MAELSPELPDVVTTGTEEQTLVQMLDFYRAVLARKGSGLSPEQLATPLPMSDLTIGGLIFHMALVEDNWFHKRFAGHDEPEPWASAPWEDDMDWEIHHAKELTPDALFAQYETSIARSEAAYATCESLDQVASATGKDDQSWNMRWILIHMIEEYARHCGHADLLRQSIDGVTDD